MTRQSLTAHTVLCYEDHDVPLLSGVSWISFEQLSNMDTQAHRHTGYTSIGGDKTLVIPTQHSLLHTRLARSDGILYVQAKIT